jgi:hypothetical protein
LIQQSGLIDATGWIRLFRHGITGIFVYPLVDIPHAGKTMTRLLVTFTLIAGLSGCVAYAPPGYYGYAPAYYGPPPISVGIGGVFHIH